jgi:hypothetical protein
MKTRKVLNLPNFFSFYKYVALTWDRPNDPYICVIKQVSIEAGLTVALISDHVPVMVCLEVKRKD